MLKKIKNKILEKRYKKATPIYIIACWADYGVMPAMWTGKIVNGHPTIIEWTDHNGTSDYQYYITPWYNVSSGIPIGYSFNRTNADNITKRLRNAHN